MTERREEEPGGHAEPLPRDLPDQQVGGMPGPDPWEGKEPREDGGAEDVPDTDQAGTGRRGSEAEGGRDDGTPEEPSD